MDRRLISLGVLLICIGPALYYLRVTWNFVPELLWWFRIKCAVAVSLGLLFVALGVWARSS